MERITGNYKSVTILRSWPAATASGATALVLETQESGTIAFVVTLATIPILRDALAQAERLLMLGTGNA